MKKIITVFILICCLYSSLSLANAKSVLDEDTKKIIFITQLYQEVFEKKDISQMDSYFSKKLSFQANFNLPVDYESLKEHLIQINQECVVLKALPFDEVIVTGNQVITLYTQSCTDKFNKINKKRIMAITEIDKNNMVSKIQVVTNTKVT